MGGIVGIVGNNISSYEHKIINALKKIKYRGSKKTIINSSEYFIVGFNQPDNDQYDIQSTNGDKNIITCIDGALYKKDNIIYNDNFYNGLNDLVYDIVTEQKNI